MVFYHEIRAILDKFIQIKKDVGYIQYSNFDEPEAIGSGGYGTVYTAKYKNDSAEDNMAEAVVFKKFKNFNQMAELFINEVSIT